MQPSLLFCKDCTPRISYCLRFAKIDSRPNQINVCSWFNKPGLEGSGNIIMHQLLSDFLRTRYLFQLVTPCTGDIAFTDINNNQYNPISVEVVNVSGKCLISSLT